MLIIKCALEGSVHMEMGGVYSTTKHAVHFFADARLSSTQCDHEVDELQLNQQRKMQNKSWMMNIFMSLPLGQWGHW